MIGKTISHYKILEKLGEGGMGVVYKAEDTKLDRLVALKFISPQSLKSEEEKARFIQEAKAAAAINHANITTIHEIDEDADDTFISMEYIEGNSLKEKIDSGPLKIDEALKIAAQIAEGLQEAHEKGIVHRDIKSANIMVTAKGQVKIMDFGLAKLKGKSKLTKVGTTVGTAAYMSPEQSMGKKVDRRTDIWSLGIVLYEMITGQLPFKGDYEQAVVYSILNEEPEPVTAIRTGVPQELERIINKALVKDPSDRYQHADELIVDLHRVKKDSKLDHSITEKKEKSIIVLPFVNMSPDPDQEYFSDGLTEEIITDLSYLHDLLVISRSSAMTFKGTKKKIKEIAREVNVQYVLEGSVRKVGNKLRITAQLIDATTDAHLWAQKYNGTLDDIFDIQEKVSRSIVDELKVRLSAEEIKQMAERHIDNVEAYEHYLKANAEIFKFTEDASNRGIKYLQKALDIIGDNALLYSGMAFAYFNLVNIGYKQEDYLIKAEEYVNKALAIDPEFPQAHIALGWIYCLDNPVKSSFHLKKALAVSPDNMFALTVLAVNYLALGKGSEAARLSERLMQINPLDFQTNYCQGLLPFYSGQNDKALVAWRKLYEMYPDSGYSKFSYALILIYTNQQDEAFSIIDQSTKTDPKNVLTKIGLMLKYAVLGEKEKAFQQMTPDFQKTCQRDYSYAHHLAGIFSLLGAKEEALNWLESAVNSGFINYPFLNEYDLFLENIRGEERFKKLMKRVKQEWENFEV